MGDNVGVLEDELYRYLCDGMQHFPYNCIDNVIELKKVVDIFRNEFIKCYKMKFKSLSIDRYKYFDFAMKNVSKKYIKEIHLKKWFVLMK